ncbi:hypothetical protein FQN60_004107, partial [Etheostoma spectabile]
MAVCALTMLDGMGDEVTAAGGVFLLVLALVFAWLSTHVADRGDHILGTILTVGAHASLIGLGGPDSYSGGSASADTPEQQAPPPSQENKPDDGEPGTERGEGEETGEGAEGVRTDFLLDIQSKQPQAGRMHTSDDEEEEEEEEEEEDELEEEDKKIIKHIPVLSSTICPITTTTSASISVRREHQIKLIYQGQLLQDPKKTLLSLNITHNSVIHCHISQALHEATPEEGAQSGPGAGVGPGVSGGLRAAGVAISTSSLVVPVFVVILAVVWYFRINYRQFFTTPATISLVGVT